ncbi:hypothetical protein FRC07_005211 [Ceratobasidium sp. 392]|nr:hypothetical protein FRC07_005211 [Ceratobasidium sp. 392]
MFMCSSIYQDEETGEESIIPGKLTMWERWGVLVYYAMDGRERQTRGTVQILKDTRNMRWVRTSKGAVPPGCRPVVGGHTMIEGSREVLYHCTVWWRGQRVPGYTSPRTGHAVITWDGWEWYIEDGYELLCWNDVEKNDGREEVDVRPSRRRLRDGIPGKPRRKNQKGNFSGLLKEGEEPSSDADHTSKDRGGVCDSTAGLAAGGTTATAVGTAVGTNVERGGRGAGRRSDKVQEKTEEAYPVLFGTAVEETLEEVLEGALDEAELKQATLLLFPISTYKHAKTNVEIR